MIEAFFFGPSDRQVFGSYHPAAGGGGQVLTVICPPLFNEYMRTHAALRMLAISLAERGQHVLRFDYRGTGDSSGELDEVTLSDWLEDIALAVREGCDLTGSSAVRILGVRAGALLASKAFRACGEVQRMVLWDPVADGAGYLLAMRRIQNTMIETGVASESSGRSGYMHEYAGYRLSGRMVDEFSLLDESTYSEVPAGALRMVSTAPEVTFPVKGATWDVARFACQWEGELEDLITPKVVLECLCTCLTQA